VSLPKREDFKQFIRMPVRWGDMDSLGHVNNATFFTYDESGRLAYFDELARDDPKFFKEYGIILASISCDFLMQLHYPAELDIGTRISRIGRSSMNTQAAMFNGDKLVAVTRGVVVWFNYVAQQTLPVPGHIREWIRGREVVAPEE
jgi:acyl-CoA thioester hydrolase